MPKAVSLQSGKVFGYLLTTCTRRQQPIHPADVGVVLIVGWVGESKRSPILVEDPADPVLNLPTATLSFIHGLTFNAIAGGACANAMPDPDFK